MSASTRYFLREALRQAWRQRLLTLVAASALAMGTLFGGAWLLLWRNGQYWSSQVGQAAQLDAFLQAGSSATAQAEAQEAARALSGVAGVELVSPQAAKESLSQDPQIRQAFDLLGNENPLPARLKVALVSVDPIQAAQVARELQAMPGIEAVDDGEGSVQRVLRLNQALRTFVLGLGLLFSAAALAIVIVVLRLTAWARRQELGIMRLVGASHGFIRVPFLLEGLIQGLLGGAAAALALTLALNELSRSLRVNLALNLKDFMPLGMDWGLGLALALASGLLGLLGAWLALATLTLAYEEEEGDRA